MTARYLELVRWAYDGEVFGAAFLRSLLDGASHPSRQPQLRALLELEAQTLDAVAPVAVRELGALDDSAALAKAAGYAERVAAASWAWFLDELEHGANRALPTFAELAGLSPTADRDLFERLVEHERVMGEFARLDRSGAADAALALIETHLAGEAAP